MAKPKKVDPLKAREKRAKIMVCVLLLVLVVVGAIMIPPVLKQGGPPPEDTAAPPSTTTVSLPGTSPTTGAATPSTTGAPASTAGELADTDVPPASSDDQLVSFSVFQAKNPFAPQVKTVSGNQPDTSGSTTGSTTPATGDTGGTPTDTTVTQTTTTPSAPTGTTSVVPSTPGAGSTGTTTTPTVTAAGVTITVNGHASNVAAQETFPSGAPVFRLVSFTSTSAQIGIVGGSYATGGATLTLPLGKPVTLENQTDGKRYTLELTKSR